MTAAGFPPTATILVGDAVRDVEAARAAGIRAVLVRTGKGLQAEAELGESGVAAFDGLADAVAAMKGADGGDSGLATGGVEGWIRRHFADHRAVLDATASTVAPALGDVIAASASCLDAGGKILICGNGGSAADAQHLAAELVCRFRADRGALPAIALHTDTSAVTAIANDLGYEAVFARQVEALARPGDLLIAISTSGRSQNVIQAARVARERGCTVVAMTGRGGGYLAAHAHYLLTIPADEVSHIQEMHAICIHALADALERHATTERDAP
jgi:D-sedoheptulose 7-phosphate isomerase